MFPGLTTKVSESNISLATTVTQNADVLRVTSTATTTVLATIVPAFGGFSGICFLQNKSGANMTTVTTGNIVNAVTVLSNRMAVLVYSKLEGKWTVCQDT
jgi:hypothetical protein